MRKNRRPNRGGGKKAREQGRGRGRKPGRGRGRGQGRGQDREQYGRSGNIDMHGDYSKNACKSENSIINDDLVESLVHKTQLSLPSMKGCRKQRPQHIASVEMSEENQNMLFNLVQKKKEESKTNNNLNRKNIVDSSNSSNKQLKFQQKVDEQMIEKLQKLGFKYQHIRGALRDCVFPEIKPCDLVGNISALSRKMVDDSLPIAVDWLVMTVPERDLPTDYASRKDRIIFLNSSMQNINPMQEEIERNTKGTVISQYGFPRETVVDALIEAKQDEIRTLELLWDWFDIAPCVKKEDNEILHDEVSVKDLKDMLDDEIETLEAMYGDDFSVKRSENQEKDLPDSTFVTLFITLNIESVVGKCVLEMRIPNNSRYPYETPFVLFLNTDPSFPSTARLPLLQALAMEILPLLGTPMMFTLATWLDENLAKFLKPFQPKVTVVKKKGNKNKNEK